MSLLRVELPDDLYEFVQSRAAEKGCGSVSEYLEGLISADQQRLVKQGTWQGSEGADAVSSQERTTHSIRVLSPGGTADSSPPVHWWVGENEHTTH